jgi:hypothetical protein
MHENNEKAQKQIHFMMEQLDLVDSFRELNPDIKRYTWRGVLLILMLKMIKFPSLSFISFSI